MATPIAPGFLVAAPWMQDPSFQEAVVLLVDHQPQGALGFVVNRPARLSFRAILDELEIPSERAPDVPVMLGGPVAPHTGWLLFDPTELPLEAEGYIEVAANLRVSASKTPLNQLARRPEAKRQLLLLGYAGWGAGQLEGELKAGSWIPVDLDAEVIFQTPSPERWEAALQILGIDPKLIVAPVIQSLGGAQRRRRQRLV